jgi:hypothetical protein
MESDTVRTVGDSTLVELWIRGKSRAITISRQAIEAYLGGGMPMTETERREFVRTHLALVVETASRRLREDPDAEDIVIDSLGGAAPAPSGERRRGDRRKGERRKQNLGPPGGVERRR